MPGLNAKPSPVDERTQCGARGVRMYIDQIRNIIGTGFTITRDRIGLGEKAIRGHALCDRQAPISDDVIKPDAGGAFKFMITVCHLG